MVPGLAALAGAEEVIVVIASAAGDVCGALSAHGGAAASLMAGAPHAVASSVENAVKTKHFVQN